MRGQTYPKFTALRAAHPQGLIFLVSWQVNLVLFALWAELIGYGDAGPHITAIIEERAREFSFTDIVKCLPPSSYCADLAGISFSFLSI